MNIRGIKEYKLSSNGKDLDVAMYDYGLSLVQNPELTSTPVRACFYQLVWVSAGCGVIVCDGCEFSFGPNMVLIGQPGQISCTKYSQGVQGVGICFNERFLYDETQDEIFSLRFSLLDTMYCQPCHQLKGTEIDWISELITRFKYEYENGGGLIGHRAMLQNIFRLILLSVQRTLHNCAPARMELTNTDHHICASFRRKVEEHYREVLSVEEYARLLSVSEKRLFVAVTKTLGTTPYRYIRERMATEAGRLLLYSDCTLSEIASVFDMDPSNFNKFFRTFYNVSPAEYRKRNCM